MLRISRTASVNPPVTLRLEGSLVGPWVAEAEQACEEVLATLLPLRLHIAELVYADRKGVALLAGLRSRGVALVECPLFMQEQLKAVSK